MLLLKRDAAAGHAGLVLHLELAGEVAAPHGLDEATVFLLQLLGLGQRVRGIGVLVEVALGLVEQALLHGLEQLGDARLQLVERDGDLLAVVAADGDAVAGLDVLRADLDAQRHALHLPVGELPAGAVVAEVALRAQGDFSDNSPGWKFANWEMKGVPLRVEIGPKDIEAGHCVAVRRDNGEKITVALDELEARIPELLETVQQGLFDKAKRNLDEHTYAAHSLAEAKELQEKNGGFIKTMWCGDLACELEMKDKAGMSSRCIPFEQEHLDDVCPVCGKPAKCMIYWGVAY